MGDIGRQWETMGDNWETMGDKGRQGKTRENKAEMDEIFVREWALSHTLFAFTPHSLCHPWAACRFLFVSVFVVFCLLSWWVRCVYDMCQAKLHPRTVSLLSVMRNEISHHQTHIAHLLASDIKKKTRKKGRRHTKARKERHQTQRVDGNRVFSWHF